MSNRNDWDTIVIGAGPAGATASALLAEKGKRVLVLEKDHFPRYHIGESMMPFCWDTLDRLGLAGKMDEIGFQQKLSVQFVSTGGKISKPFYFFQHTDHPRSTTWQVERAEFDNLLASRACELGAEIREGHKVLGLLRDGDGADSDRDGAVVGVWVENGDGQRSEIHAPLVIDASGRDCVAASKEKWRSRDPRLDKIAIWTYYEGAMRDPGLDEGSTTVAYIPEKGWFWYIPMRDDRISVGVVADRDYLYRESRDPEEIFQREIQENAWIREHVAPGRPTGEYRVTGEYSYRSRFCAADGLVLVGDAFAFLDPVFSSGLFLALKSGELAADAAGEALDAGDCSAERFGDYGRELCRAMERMRKIVYAFYEPEFNFGKLIKAHPHLRPLLTDLLIGDLFEDKYEELFAAVEEICPLPPDLDYGHLVEGALAES